MKTSIAYWFKKFLFAGILFLNFSQIPCHGYGLVDQNGCPGLPLRRLMVAIGGDENWNLATINSHLEKNFFQCSRRNGEQLCNLMEELQWEDLEPIFHEMGMIDAIRPLASHYHYLIIFGESIPLMRMQLQFIRELQNANQVYFDRVIFLENWQESSDTTNGIEKKMKGEHDAAKNLLKEYFPRGTVPWKIISKNPRRQDGAIHQWLKSRPKAASALMVGSNPYIFSQLEPLRGALKQCGWFQRKGSLDFCGNGMIDVYGDANRIFILMNGVARTLREEMNNRKCNDATLPNGKNNLKNISSPTNSGP
ncbi:MAG: hypothetical protein LBG86_01445 [Puniceicoccales bacterium]|jgi:hypothetical protein|nr:hypothetical protein [Puniceicoccales bacterium]